MTQKSDVENIALSLKLHITTIEDLKFIVKCENKSANLFATCQNYYEAIIKKLVCKNIERLKEFFEENINLFSKDEINTFEDISFSAYVAKYGLKKGFSDDKNFIKNFEKEIYAKKLSEILFFDLRKNNSTEYLDETFKLFQHYPKVKDAFITAFIKCYRNMDKGSLEKIIKKLGEVEEEKFFFDLFDESMKLGAPYTEYMTTNDNSIFLCKFKVKYNGDEFELDKLFESTQLVWDVALEIMKRNIINLDLCKEFKINEKKVTYKDYYKPILEYCKKKKEDEYIIEVEPSKEKDMKCCLNGSNLKKSIHDCLVTSLDKCKNDYVKKILGDNTNLYNNLYNNKDLNLGEDLPYWLMEIIGFDSDTKPFIRVLFPKDSLMESFRDKDTINKFKPKWIYDNKQKKDYYILDKDTAKKEEKDFFNYRLCFLNHEINRFKLYGEKTEETEKDEKKAKEALKIFDENLKESSEFFKCLQEKKENGEEVELIIKFMKLLFDLEDLIIKFDLKLDFKLTNLDNSLKRFKFERYFFGEPETESVDLMSHCISYYNRNKGDKKNMMKIIRKAKKSDNIIKNFILELLNICNEQLKSKDNKIYEDDKFFLESIFELSMKNKADNTEKTNKIKEIEKEALHHFIEKIPDYICSSRNPLTGISVDESMKSDIKGFLVEELEKNKDKFKLLPNIFYMIKELFKYQPDEEFKVLKKEEEVLLKILESAQKISENNLDENKEFKRKKILFFLYYYLFFSERNFPFPFKEGTNFEWICLSICQKTAKHLKEKSKKENFFNEILCEEFQEEQACQKIPKSLLFQNNGKVISKINIKKNENLSESLNRYFKDIRGNDDSTINPRETFFIELEDKDKVLKALDYSKNKLYINSIPFLLYGIEISNQSNSQSQYYIKLNDKWYNKNNTFKSSLEKYNISKEGNFTAKLFFMHSSEKNKKESKNKIYTTEDIKDIYKDTQDKTNPENLFHYIYSDVKQKQTDTNS